MDALEQLRWKKKKKDWQCRNVCEDVIQSGHWYFAVRDGK